ncbi:MAG: hypothetical protein H6659_12985 [Ardenticatenaceae bacterium]|nr:hypothetical protein [Ardenticatenaceae bacterium]
MTQTPFLWLGANRARRWPVGDKARLLDKAAHAGLPVSAGAILLDEFFALLAAEGVVDVRDGIVTAVDDDWLHETLYEGIRFPRLDAPAIIRAAFSVDGAALTADPRYAPQRAVHLDDPAQLARGLCRVWSSAAAAGLRRDVLLMEMIAAEIEGTAVTTANAPDPVTSQAANASPETITLPQLGRFGRPDAALPPFAQRLQMLLRGVRRTFGGGVWQVDWLDDGRICWIIQLHARSI